jgi:hypothetical protein
MKFLLSFCFVAFATSLAAATPTVSDIVNRARATVGTESALDGMITLQMTGGLEPADSKMPAATLLIVARKPCSQRLEIKIDDIVETTILNGENGCLIRSNLHAGASQMRQLTAPEFARVAFSTRQFFSFYRPDFKNGERITYEGVEQRHGVRSHKLLYTYPDGISTVRYFSVNEDALVSTITDNGVESVSVGVQNVGGIRFPERIEYYENGEEIHTIVLTKIIVNKPLMEGIFDLPKAEEK